MKKWLFLDVVAIVILLLISYLIYYNRILTPVNILSHNFGIIKNQYQMVVENLINYDVTNNLTLEGTINLNNLPFNYNLIINKNKFKLDIVHEESSVSYYIENQMIYQKENDGVYQKKSFFIKELPSVQTLIKTIEENSYKKMYFEEKIPIVEINITLNEDDLNRLFRTNIKDDYNILVTLKNNALTNLPITSKVIVSNETTNQRNVLLYENQTLKYINNGGETYSFEIENQEKNQDFNLLINKDEELYGQLIGTKLENSYEYKYQLINEKYNLKLVIENDVDNDVYTFSSEIEDSMSDTLEITLTKTDDIILDNVINSETYKNQTTNKISDVIVPLQNFIDKYKNSINHIYNH